MNILQTFEAEQIARLTEARAVPDFQPGDTLREFYWRNQRHFWWTFATYLVAVMLKRGLIAPDLVSWASSSWENLGFCLAAVWLGMTRRVWAHGLVLALWYWAVLSQWFGATLTR